VSWRFLAALPRPPLADVLAPADEVKTRAAATWSRRARAPGALTARFGTTVATLGTPQGELHRVLLFDG
jgi:hypothetical protein